ncbi:MAG: hypothetical protein VB934_17710 [Polyangiaceae bacterium]
MTPKKKRSAERVGRSQWGCLVARGLAYWAASTGIFASGVTGIPWRCSGARWAQLLAGVLLLGTSSSVQFLVQRVDS